MKDFMYTHAPGLALIGLFIIPCWSGLPPGEEAVGEPQIVEQETTFAALDRLQEDDANGATFLYPAEWRLRPVASGGLESFSGSCFVEQHHQAHYCPYMI